MQTVIFDLYETLITLFEPDWVPPRWSIAQRLGVDEHVFEEAWARSREAWELGEVERYQAALAQTCPAKGHAPDANVVDELAEEHRQLRAEAFETIDSRIVSLVGYLRHAGLRLAVISNAGDLKVEAWPHGALAPLVDTFVASCHVGVMKPHKEIYEVACHRLGVPPDEAAYVGDGGADELRGAAEAGLTAYWCTWFLGQWPAGARSQRFVDDEWRQHPKGPVGPYPRVTPPEDLLEALAVD